MQGQFACNKPSTVYKYEKCVNKKFDTLKFKNLSLTKNEYSYLLI